MARRATKRHAAALLLTSLIAAQGITPASTPTIERATPPDRPALRVEPAETRGIQGSISVPNDELITFLLWFASETAGAVVRTIDRTVHIPPVRVAQTDR